MNKKETKAKMPDAQQKKVVEHRNVFQDLEKRNSILLTLFDTKTKEVINQCVMAPAPSKDYCQIVLNFNQVIYRWWKITHRNDGERFNPGEIKDSFEDFTYDDIVKHHILCAFGKNYLTYIENIVSKAQLDILSRMPESILIKIISYLALEDISKLSQTNNQFRELCRSDRVWILLYQKYYSRDITRELHNLAQKKGWRSIFFTNKIKLQVELRREANGENDEGADEDRYGSVVDNSVNELMKNVQAGTAIRRHSFTTSRKSIDDGGSKQQQSGSGFASANVNKKR